MKEEKFLSKFISFIRGKKDGEEIPAESGNDIDAGTGPDDDPITIAGESEKSVKEEKSKIKKEIDNKEDEKEEPPAAIDDIKDIFQHVIKPEERTLKNYFSPSFWSEKNKQYRKLRKKEREDLNVYGILSEGARPTIEYYVLTILSSVIATIGLIQGSTAVIIGAMIVAPLMTPILAFSLGVVWGDLHLIRISISSIIKGTFLAIIISAALAFLVPIASFSHEIMSRTVPSLFDIMVAIASGIVGAYGYANKKISNTIIGIAIAVALIPPLCTIGIGIGTFNLSMTTGAAVLFIINLISIGLAGAIVFWMMKIHPVLADKDEIKKRALSQIAISLFILSIIAGWVGYFMYEHYQTGQVKEKVLSTMRERFPDLTIISIKTEKTESGLTINLTITGSEMPDDSKIKSARREFLEKNPYITTVKLRFIKSELLLK